ncbi:Uncharacterised protein [Vibrio cholerae]|nr:Uncharacterised protein [Vibrio cholerae]
MGKYTHTKYGAVIGDPDDQFYFTVITIGGNGLNRNGCGLAVTLRQISMHGFGCTEFVIID